MKDVVLFLIEHGAATDIREECVHTKEPRSGDSPLIMAAMGGHKDVVECLLNFGADLEMKGVV
jgi:ankyrin repeat protein